MNIGPLTVEFDWEWCVIWWTQGPWNKFVCRVCYPTWTYLANLGHKTKLLRVYGAFYAILLDVDSGEIADVEISKEDNKWTGHGPETSSYRAMRAYVDKHYVNVHKGKRFTA